MKHIFLLAVFTLASVAISSPRTKEFSIQFPELKSSRLNDSTQVFMENHLNTMEGGLPSVPVHTLKIAIPEGLKLKSVTWLPQSQRQQTLSSPIAVASSQMPISWLGKIPARIAQTPPQNFSGTQYPAARYDYSVQKLHGVSILIVNLYPVQVASNRRDTVVSQSGLLKLEWENGTRLNLQPFSHQLQEVSRLVENPEDVASYSRNGLRDRAKYDYLILSTQNFINYSGPNSLSTFQASLKSRGLESKVVDVATLRRIDPAGDLIESIRNYVKKEYSENGIRYLLLAGEGRESQSTAIPIRKLWSKVNAYFGSFTGWTPIEVDIPADTYYGCLDGEFNSNHNSHWGEPEDGTGGADVDFLAEVTVGRAVLRDTTDLQNFVSKSTSVASAGLAANVLFLGEMLFEEKDLYGDEYMDQLIGNVEEHGFTTSGYGSHWNQSKLYDRKNEWSGSEAQAQINQMGFGMVNHLGHSNNSTNMRLTTSKIASFKNTAPYFYYTQGCYAAGFNTGSFVDRLVAAPFAAVAAIGNTSYGLAPEDPQPTLTKTPGASQMLHRRFVHSLLAAPHTALGKAHVASKEFFIGLKSAQEVRWVNWTANYFGDPSLTVDR